MSYVSVNLKNRRSSAKKQEEPKKKRILKKEEKSKPGTDTKLINTPRETASLDIKSITEEKMKAAST